MISLARHQSNRSQAWLYSFDSDTSSNNKLQAKRLGIILKPLVIRLVAIRQIHHLTLGNPIANKIMLPCLAR